MLSKRLSRRRFVTGLGMIGSGLALFRPHQIAHAEKAEEAGKVGRRKRSGTTRVGIALGGGGAKGLAHILMLEALDELGVTPSCISGCSMGAVIGALYASGLSGSDIRAFIGRLVISGKETWSEALFRKDVLKWIDFIDPELGKGGIIDGENFIQYLHKAVPYRHIEDLAIPLKIVAADFWRREEVVLESGDLPDAVKASMALPGLFTPVLMHDRVLVDGGTVNPVPYDLLIDDCDIVIAVDVMGQTSVDTHGLPSFFDAIFNTVHIMQQSILVQKMRYRRPDIYIRPDMFGIRMLEFYKADTIYRYAETAKLHLKRELEKRLA
jgi:NTE family protein